MKILLSNYSLDWLGGTQTWCMTMAKELVVLGHEVHLFAADGKYNLMPDYPVYDGGYYDLALINHNICLSALEGANIKYKVFTSHGVIPHLEQPVKGADFYISVSEEVQQNLKKQGFLSNIIRNPIDTEKFIPIHPINHKLMNVLFMSNYQGEATKVIQQACREKKLNLKIFGKNGDIGVQADALTEMNWADLVIGLGRTAYEAMSCGRNVLIYDYNGADGLANEKNIYNFRQCNCSGRYGKQKLSVKDLKEIFNNYDPNNSMRQYIKANNNVKTIAQQYINLRNY